ncbi:MAG: CDP-alcohol phosphatidyltransferase family protein [Bacteroidaceae bacterium]|nr:CDP-alcohol phosphatidyltransferase family protein [Bacteroidaceae bacterium]MBP9637506.1 CDP-alcohol phosphatidyltransferase family protein [Bacteroidaceae bacterium]
MKEKGNNLEASLKSLDTEEFLDIHFYRPVGYQWARFFQRLGVTPNTITILSIFLGIGAGICFYFQDFGITLLGIFLLIWANTYDSADGQLARLTGQKSELGRILDGASGDLWFISIYIAICLRLMPEQIPTFLTDLFGCNSQPWGFTIFILAILAGLAHSQQACMADYYRNIHLFFLKGKAGSELDHASLQEKIYKELSFSKQPVRKTFQYFYKGYTRKQEKRSPQCQEFFSYIKQYYGDEATKLAPENYGLPADLLPEWVRADFRKGSLPLMKYCNILTFNTRAIVLSLSLLVGEPWFYFAFELTILLALYLYLVHAHEKLCRKLTIKIKNKAKQA